MTPDLEHLVPRRDTSDTATLAAWYFGADTLFGCYRKVLLAGCKESFRAEVSWVGGPVGSGGIKYTEARLDDLAHTHPAYLAYLALHLDGRREWLAHYLAEGGMK